MQPQYKLRDDHGVTAKHMRDERIRNDNTYTTKTQIENYVPDRIAHMNAISYHIANSNEVINGQTPMNMNSQQITNLAAGTLQNHAINLNQLDTGLATKANFSDTNTALTNQLGLINTKLSLSGGTMTGNLNMGGNRLIQTYNPQVNHDVVNKEFLDAQLLLKTNVTSTDALNTRVTNVETASVNNADAIISLSSNLSTSYNTKTQDLALFKPKDQIENKIEHTSQLAAISCDSNRYISIKSNGNKIADILEDEVNAGFTLNTNNKRLNLVSQQPQTQYHNSNTGVFNFKFTGTSDIITPGYTNYGLLQIAPSNITNLNPAVNLISSRINGLGSVGSLYLDSTYGSIQTPLIVSPQTLSDAGGTQMIQYRSTATPVLKNQFQGKTGYSTITDITEPNQYTSKSYVDAQITSGSGISQANADLRYYRNNVTLNNIVVPSGILSMNNFKISSLANGTLANDAVSLSQVQSLISSGASGQSISTNSGYGIFTGLNDIQKKLNNSTYATQSTFFGVYDEIYSNNINRRQYRMANQGVVNYIHSQYLVQNAPGRTLIQLSDIGSEGTQCARISVLQRNSANTDHENENYLQFKPLQNKIEVSVPIFYITEPASFSGTQLVTKTHLDAVISGSSSGIQNKIITSIGTANPMTVQCNNGQVSVALSSGIPDQLQLTGNTITQVSGNSLQLQRGTTTITLTDDGSTQNVGLNTPIIYSGSYTTASTDQLISQRIADGRFMKKSADSNLVMNNNKVTGLSDANSNGDAIHFGQVLALMRTFGFRRSKSISIYAGDLPLSNNFTIPAQNITSDAGIGSISVIHKTTSASANYFQIDIQHNFNTNNIRLFTQAYSTNNNPIQITWQNDNGFGQFTTNQTNPDSNTVAFWLVYEPNASDPSTQSNGYVILLQEWV